MEQDVKYGRGRGPYNIYKGEQTNVLFCNKGLYVDDFVILERLALFLQCLEQH